MREAGERPPFAFETQLPVARRDVRGAHDLEGDAPSHRLELFGEEDRPHPTLAEKAQDAIRADGGEAAGRRQGAALAPAVHGGRDVLG